MPPPLRSDSRVSRRRFLSTLVATGGVLTADRVSGAAVVPDSASESFRESARDIRLNDDADVIVCGAGPAGVAAALTAARAGARTRLFEAHGCLGGVWTAGLLTYVFDADKPGVNRELTRLLRERGAAQPTSAANYLYDAEAMKLLLEEKCLDAGVKIRLFTRVVAAHRDSDQQLRTIVTESKSGREAWRARAFVDATGDGDLGALAGCAWEFGESTECPCQPMTMNAFVSVPDPEALRPFISFYDGDPQFRQEPLRNLRAELKRAGVEPSYGKPTLFQARGRLLTLMANHEFGVRPFDAADVTAATLRARAEINRIVRGLRNLGGPWRDLQLVSTAEQIGVRDGRRILGRYQLTRNDLEQGSRFADGVALATFNVDIHAPTRTESQRYTNTSRGISMRPYEIPLRALVARDVGGLLMAGRCISGDFIAHSSYRVTGNAVATGEAAGAVAALAAQSRRLPHEVAWSEAAPVLARARSLAL